MMKLAKMIIAMTALFGAFSGGSIASAPSTAIDLNNPDVLMDDAKPKEVKAVLFIKPVPGTGLQAQVIFDPDLVDSLYDLPDNTRFANSQVRNAISGMSYLYKRLADVAGSQYELKNRLNRFIDVGRPLGALFTLDFTDPKLALDNPANATAYQQLSNILRWENYGEPTAGDVSAEQAARQAVFVANQAKKEAFLQSLREKEEAEEKAHSAKVALEMRAAVLAKHGLTEANITAIKADYGVTDDQFDFENGTVCISDADIPLSSLI
ncbi:MAG: hypothetical protein K2Q34_01900 [Alphaproteobacteria bacterium]|nr:hypothetical protein [Alphaproteobacteria bacterium]